MISKKDQTRKVKRVNSKKMSFVELNLYKDYIREIADDKCQNPNCDYQITEFHHSMRSINKDDRSITGICLMCHSLLHFSTDTHKREALTILFKSIGVENWRGYTE